MRHHIDLAGVTLIIYGAFQILVGLVLVAIYLLMALGMTGIGLAEGEGELIFMGGFFGIFSLGIGAVIAVFAIPYIVAGMGIRSRASWGRIMGIVMAAMSLMNVPIGTAVGIFVLVVMLDNEVADAFKEAQS